MRTKIAALALGPLLLASCATTKERVHQFDEFAEVGRQFTAAVAPALDDSFAMTASVDSLVLEESREALELADRAQSLGQADQALRGRLAILRDLKRHLGGLASYFAALESLAETDAESSGLTGVAGGLVESLGKLDARISEATIGGASIKDLVKPATELAVAAYQSHVLNRELEKHGDDVANEIQLQQAVLAQLAEVMRAEREAIAAKAYRDAVELPYVKPGELPSSWAETRIELLESSLAATSIDAAAAAAAGLHASFVELVENKLRAERLAAVRTDIDAILSALEAAKQAREGVQPGGDQ